MKLRSTIIATAAVSTSLALLSCGGGPNFSYQNVRVTITPEIKSIPVNATQIFNTSTVNAPNVPLWSINGNYTSGLVTGGSFNSSTENPSSATFTAPTAPPIYTDAQVSAGAVQGSVRLSAGVSVNPNSSPDLIVTSESFVIIGPISVGISPPMSSVQLTGTQQFAGYVVGSVDTGLNWQVDGVGGGSLSGIVTPTGLYTAPSAIPVPGKIVTVSAVSLADPTKSASSVVTLTPP
jgi:hypothetical protein